MSGPLANGRRITGAPPGAQPIHVLGTVAVTVDLDPYLGMAALAAYLGLSRRTLQDLVNDPTDPLPTFRVGARLLARRSEVDAWMAPRRNRKPLAAAALAAADARAILVARPATRPPREPVADQQNPS
jgi:excisionase family DNA binding protein